MKLDKYIKVEQESFTETPDGGTTTTTAIYWQGWAMVLEKSYNTVLESGQYVGAKASEFTIYKNELSELIDSTMLIDYRGNKYVIKDVIELDPFYLKIVATKRERYGV